jgi:hypothetical protein
MWINVQDSVDFKKYIIHIFTSLSTIYVHKVQDRLDLSDT